MVARGLLAPAAAVTVAGLVVGFAPWFRPGAVVSTAVAAGTVAGIAVLPAGTRNRLGWSLLPPGVVSLVATVVVALTGTGTNDPAPGTTLEVAALLLILIQVTRWSEGWALPVVTVVTAAAQVLWLTRYSVGAPWWQQVLGCAFWGLGSAVAIAFGAYPRWAAGRLRRTVESERAAQQRQLERDLHDYVAHDLSGMIVQAQAARYAADGDATALAAALQRIEDAGHRAMSSMDRALSLLRTHDQSAGGSLTPRPGVDELAALVARFDQGSTAATELVVRGSVATVPREVGEVLYRAASEALTNVHRHAGSAVATVEVTLDVTPSAAGLTVVDQVRGAWPPGPARPDGGTGLSELRERVAALDGVLEAGPTGSGWRVAVCVPYVGGAPA